MAARGLDRPLVEAAVESLPNLGGRLAAIEARLAWGELSPEQAALVGQVRRAFESLLDAIDQLGATIPDPAGRQRSPGDRACRCGNGPAGPTAGTARDVPVRVAPGRDRGPSGEPALGT